MHKTMILTFISVVSLFIGATSGRSQAIKLSLHLESNDYIESQSIWAVVALVNNTTTVQHVQPLVFTEDIERGIQFVLQRDDGGTVSRSCGGYYDDFETAKPKTIPPRDSIVQWTDIITWFSTGDNLGSPPYLATMHYLKSGTYVLRAMQFTGKDTLWSNWVRFRVVTAIGKQLLALKALRDADSKYFANVHDNGADLLYERFLTSFAQSVYAPYAYYRLIFTYHDVRLGKKKDRAFELLEQLAERFPNHPQSVDLLSGYAPILLSEGKRDILEKLARDFAQTKVGQLSQRKLLELK